MFSILFPKKAEGNLVMQNKLSIGEKLPLTQRIAGNLPQVDLGFHVTAKVCHGPAMLGNPYTGVQS